MKTGDPFHLAQTDDSVLLCYNTVRNAVRIQQHITKYVKAVEKYLKSHPDAQYADPQPGKPLTQWLEADFDKDKMQQTQSSSHHARKVTSAASTGAISSSQAFQPTRNPLSPQRPVLKAEHSVIVRELQNSQAYNLKAQTTEYDKFWENIMEKYLSEPGKFEVHDHVC